MIIGPPTHRQCLWPSFCEIANWHVQKIGAKFPSPPSHHSESTCESLASSLVTETHIVGLKHMIRITRFEAGESLGKLEVVGNWACLLYMFEHWIKWLFVFRFVRGKFDRRKQIMRAH